MKRVTTHDFLLQSHMYGPEQSQKERNLKELRFWSIKYEIEGSRVPVTVLTIQHEA